MNRDETIHQIIAYTAQGDHRHAFRLYVESKAISYTEFLHAVQRGHAYRIAHPEEFEPRKDLTNA